MVIKERVEKIKSIIGQAMYNRLSTDWYYRIPFDEILSAFDFLVGFEKQKIVKREIDFDESRFFGKVSNAIEYLKSLPKDAVIEVNSENGHLVYVVDVEESYEEYLWRIRHKIERMECTIVAVKEKREKLLKEKEQLEKNLASVEEELKELTGD